MQKQKRITLNAEKRKVIADQFQIILKIIQNLTNLARRKRNNMILCVKSKREIEKLVRYHQPQEDVDTISRMINKYGE